MKIELKNISHSKALSEETNAFSATVFIDGKRAGAVSNNGHGGAHRYHPYELEKTLNDYAKTLPPIVSDLKNNDGTPFTYAASADTLIDEVFADALEAKDMKRLCAKKTLFREAGKEYKKGEWISYNRPFTPEFKAWVLAKHPAATFANEIY